MAVQFTEAEMLILSSLAYSDTGVTNIKSFYDTQGRPIDEPLSVKVLLPQLEHLATSGGYDKNDFPDPESKRNYEAAIASLQKKLTENDFVITKSINHNTTNESGFSAFAIEPRENPDRQVIVCCRGSDALDKMASTGDDNTINDWVGADAALAWDEETLQQEEIRQFMMDFTDYDHVNLTGHSLGGNLAMYGGISFSNPDALDGVYSFDGPGFNAQFIGEHRQDIERIENKIYNFQNENDMVSSMLTSVGTVIIVESAIESENLLTNHNRWTIAVEPDGTIIRTANQEKNVACEAIHLASVSAVSFVKINLFMVSTIAYYGTKFAQIVVLKTAELLKELNSGYQKATSSPYIKVDTDRMRSYANRLWAVNRKLESIDRRMDKLYKKVGLRDLLSLIKADVMTGKCNQIQKCAKYLSETASDFDKTEQEVSNLF